MPMFSVILPTYNRAYCLADSIDSVLAQTERDFELLVIDDGSTDGTKELVGGYDDPRLRYIYQRNGGVSSARNLGTRLAEGAWIALQDSDDRWHAQKLARIRDEIARSSPDFIYHAMRYTFEDGRELRVPSETMPEERKRGRILPALLVRNHIGAPTITVRKDILEQVGGFDETLPALEDYDLVLRLARDYEAGYVDEILIETGRSDDGITAGMSHYMVAACRLVGKYKADYLATGTLNERLEILLRQSAELGIRDQTVALLEKVLSI